MSFSRWVQSQREAKNLSRTECAKRAGVSQPVWTRYEIDMQPREWKRATVIKIAHALDVPVDEAIQAAFSREASSAFSASALESARLIDSLPPDKRSAMLRVVRSTYEALASV